VPVSLWHADWAWLGVGDHVDAQVLIDVEGDRITSVTPGIADPPPDAHRVVGLLLPGLANAHSHCFHRALRGRTNAGGGTFWTWREAMYGVAARLDPDTYYALARATFAEMALAGITTVGEFHYVHHAAGGRPYGSANAMGDSLAAAAAEAGIRMTILDTCYLAGGFGVPLDAVQLRFSDGDAYRWAERVSAWNAPAGVRVGAAIHSVRAVPADQMAIVAGWAGDRTTGGEPRVRSRARLHSDPAAPRRWSAQRQHDRCPRDALRPGRYLAARRRRRDGVHVPDDRTRPWRRDRSGA
jgi:formiminoglutamate deiminase